MSMYRLSLLLAAMMLATQSIGAQSAGEAKPRTDLYGDPLPAGAIGRLGTMRLRHAGMVSMVGFLPDGKTMVSYAGFPDQTVRLWSIATGELLTRFSLGSERAEAAFSPDRRLVAVLHSDVSRKDEIVVRDTATGKVLWRFGPLAESDQLLVEALHISADNRVLTRVAGRHISMWDLRTGKALPALDLGPLPEFWKVSYFARTPDGSLCVASASSSSAATVTVWQTRPARKLAEYRTCAPRTLIALSADGSLLAHVAEDGTSVMVHAAASGERRHVFGGRAPVQCLAFAPDGKLLAVARADGKVQFSDMRDGRECGGIDCGARMILKVLFSPSGALCAVGAHAKENLSDAEVRVWQMAPRREMLRVAGPDLGFPNAFSADDRWLAIGADHCVRFWGVASGKERHAAAGHAGPVMEIALASDERTLASAGLYSVRLWNVAARSERLQLTPKEGEEPIGRLAFTAKDQNIAAFGIRHVLTVWDAATGRRVRSGPLPDYSQRHTLAPNGQFLAGEVGNGPVRFLELPLAKSCAAFGKERAVGATGPSTFSRDATRFAGLYSIEDHRSPVQDGYQIRYWDTVHRRELPCRTALKEEPATLEFSPDGRVLAGFYPVGLSREVPQPPRPITLWEAITGAECLRIKAPARLFTLAYSPDGRLIAAGTKAGKILFLDAATGTVRGQLEGHDGPVICLQFSRDGRTLYSGGSDTTILLWDVSRVDAKVPQVERTAAGLDQDWADLASADAAKAYRAIWRLVASPRQAVPLLRRRARPVTIDAAVARWIADLDSDDFATRDAATKHLARRGQAIEPEVAAALAGNVPLETRRRLAQLLPTMRGPALPDELRLLRAMQVLELIGSPEAQAILQSLARGAAGARVTEDAAASLKRLAARGVAP